MELRAGERHSKEVTGKRIAVIENEFGTVPIDNALVISAKEALFELEAAQAFPSRGAQAGALRAPHRGATAEDLGISLGATGVQHEPLAWVDYMAGTRTTRPSAP